MARNEIEVGVRVSGVPKGVSDVRSLTDSIQKLGDATKSLETKSASGQKTLGYFKSLQTGIKDTKKQLLELQKSGSLDPAFNFESAIANLNRYDQAINRAVKKRTQIITGTKAEKLAPVFEDIAKGLEQTNLKIKESALLQKDATNAFAQMGKIRRQTTEDERKGYNKYLEDTFKGYNKQRDEFVKNVKTQYTQGTKEAEKYAKNIENLLNPAKSKTSLLQGISPLSGALFKRSDLDTQLKMVDSAMSQVGLRISNLRSGMAEAFATGRVADVTKEMKVLGHHVGIVQSTLTKQPLLQTEDSIGRLGLLQQKLKEVTKDYNTFSNPPVAKQAKKTLGIDEISGSLRTLQMKLSETTHAFGQFKLNKTPLVDLQASILIARNALKDFIKQARAGGLTDAFAKDIAGARNELKKLENDLKKAQAPISQKVRIGNQYIDLSNLDTSKQKMEALNKSAFQLSVGLQYIGRSAFYAGTALAAIGTFALRSFANLEQANMAFKSLTGSAEIGAKVFNELVQFAQKSPVDLKSLMSGTRQMLALGFSAKEVVPIMKTLTEAIAAVGASPETLDRVTLALSQIQGKGKLVGEEIRQIANTGLPILEVLTKKMGLKNVEQLYEVMKKQTINGKDAVLAIVAGLDEKFKGFLELKKHTLQGSWQILITNVEVMLGKLGEKLNQSFAIPTALLYVAGLIKDLGDLIKTFPSIMPIIQQIVMLTLALLSLAVALAIVGRLGKTFAYLASFKGLLVSLLAIPAGLIAPIFLTVGGLALIAMNLSTIALWLYKTKIAVLEWRLSFTRESALKKQLEQDLISVKKLKAEIEKSQKQKSIFGDALKTGQKEYDDFYKNLNFDEFIKKFGSVSKDVKDIWKETVKSLKDIDILGSIFGKDSDYNAAKEKIQKLKQAIQELVTGGAKEKDSKIQGFVEQIADLEIPSSLKDSLLKFKEAQQETAAEFRFSGDAIEKYKNEIKTLESGIKGLYLVQERFGTSSELLDQLNSWKSSLEDNSNSLTFLYDDKITRLKQSLVSAGQDVETLTAEFNFQNKELLKTGNALKIASAMYEFFKSKATSLQMPIDKAKEAWTKFNEEIHNTGLLLEAGIIDKFEEVKLQINAAKEVYKSLVLTKAPAAEVQGAKINLQMFETKALKLYSEEIGKLISLMNTLDVDTKDVVKVLQELGPTPTLEELLQTIQKLKDLLKKLGIETEKSWDKDKIITELKKHAITKLGDSIKNIWNQTEMSFKDVWHGALDTFVDTMVMMVTQAEFAGIAISLSMAAATAGISLVLGMLAMAFGGKKTVKVEPLTDRLKKVFDEFITDFKGAMGDFKEKLYPAKGEVSKEMSQIQRVLQGLDILRDALTTVTSIDTEGVVSSDIKGFTRETFNEINKILKETTGGHFKRVWQSAEGINKRIVELMIKLSENIVDITTLMVDRFDKIKEVVQTIYDLEKDRASFVKDMVQTIADVTRSRMSTGQLYASQQGDVSTLKGQVTTGDLALKNVTGQLTALYSLSDLTALQKIDIEYLKTEQKNLFDAQIEKIGETKEAYLTFWDTVQTLVSETLDLIGQKADFIKDIQATIDGIKNSSKSASDLFKDSIALKDTLLDKLVGKEGQEKIGILGELKSAWESIWDNAKSFFADLTAKITELTTGKTAFSEGIVDTIKTMERSVLDPVALLKKQQEDVALLQGQFDIATDADKIKLGESLKTALTSVWETGKGIFGDITSLEVELSSIDDSISKETNIAELAKLGQDKLAVQAKIDALKLGSGLTSIDKLLGETVGQLNILNTDTGSAYDGLIRVTEEVASGLGDLTGWQTKVVDGLTFLSTEGGKAYDALIGSNLQLLGIDTKATDLSGELNSTLDKTQLETIAGLQNLQLSGEGGFKDLIDVNILMLGIESLSLDYLKDIEKGIYGTLTILGEIGKNAAAATGGNIETITTTLSDLFDVPKFAAGGIVNKPTLAMIGEAGPEAVIPLNKMGQSGNVNITIDGAMIMDEITLSKFARTIGGKIRNQQLRYV